MSVRKNWMCGILGCNTKFYTDMPGVCVVEDVCVDLLGGGGAAEQGARDYCL